MEQQRFIKTDSDSFFGDYLYDQIVPQEHFLRKLLQIIDWERFTRKLIKLYKGEGVVGRPPFDPQLLLKGGIDCLFVPSVRAAGRGVYQ